MSNIYIKHRPVYAQLRSICAIGRDRTNNNAMSEPVVINLVSDEEDSLTGTSENEIVSL